MLELKGPDKVSEADNDRDAEAALEPVSDAEVSEGDEAGEAGVEDAKLLLLE